MSIEYMFGTILGTVLLMIVAVLAWTLCGLAICCVVMAVLRVIDSVYFLFRKKHLIYPSTEENSGEKID